MVAVALHWRWTGWQASSSTSAAAPPPPPPPPPPTPFPPPLYAWGVADDGRLGVDPTTLTDETDTVGAAAHTPTRVFGLHGVGVAAAAAGAGHSLVLDTTGVVWSWGLGGDGQLGHGDWASDWVPRPLPSAALGGDAAGGVVAIAAGARHSLVATADGGVWAFGSNVAGQLGLTSAVGGDNGDGGSGNGSGWRSTFFGARAPRSVATPTRIHGLAAVPIVSVAAGDAFSVALSADGGVYTFGASESGQLGHGLPPGARSLWVPLPSLVPAAGAAAAPRRVRSLAGEAVAAVAAGPAHAVALTRDGEALSWGAGRGWAHAAPGAGEADAGEPAPVAGLAGVAVAKVSPGGAHTLALTTGGEVLAWGADPAGCLGRGTTGTVDPAGLPSAAPPPAWEARGGEVTPVPLPTAAVDVAAGWGFGLAVTRGGAAYAWGGGGGGVLGHGDATDRWAPARVAGGVGPLRRVTAGFAHVLAF
ncbi:hypothetical protein I4F81_012718 [Pyropia yezoensis]|uniref:Uncharacterized protein n=1 Tax=Pyropia yezoensis TaxID=2788 RepID=A0ACC3CIY8_PYRYE|nr:hypothetical protein I4F81_012718 [Neopyropia yezoensis]